jgi:hypothetical protein
MRTWSLCLWLLLMNPGLAFSAADGTSGGTETSDEEPDCD